jgi:hypothetical protein
MPLRIGNLGQGISLEMGEDGRRWTKVAAKEYRTFQVDGALIMFLTLRPGHTWPVVSGPCFFPLIRHPVVWSIAGTVEDEGRPWWDVDDRYRKEIACSLRR